MQPKTTDKHTIMRSSLRTVTATLKSVAAYSQNRPITIPMNEKETHRDYEERVWRDRMHVTEDGYVFIPPMSFKNCISEVAKYLAIQIPGKGKATYTKHFEAGLLVIDPLILPYQGKENDGQWVFVPSNGVRGGGSRVWKCFPYFTKWRGDVIFRVLDATITEEVFQYHLEEAGKFIGVGRFRPRNNGYYGRFEIEKLSWN